MMSIKLSAQGKKKYYFIYAYYNMIDIHVFNFSQSDFNSRKIHNVYTYQFFFVLFCITPIKKYLDI